MRHRDSVDWQRTLLARDTRGRLRTVDAEGHRVLCVYLGFDPTQMPNLRERRMEANSLLTQAEHRYGADQELSRANRMALREDIQSVRELLSDDEELAPESAHGLAIFSSVPAGISEIVRLPESVDPAVAFEEQPFLEPLVELSAFERWCVLLISRRASRIFTGPREHLLEVVDVLDDVHGRHAQGGWSQARYQRGVEEEVEEHIHATCTTLFARLQRRGFDRLLVAGPAELHARVERQLHPELRRRLAGFFEIDVERATRGEVHQRALPLIETAEREREREALRRVNEGLAPAGHAVAGLDEVLELLNEGRVQVLLVAHRFAIEGFACPHCDRLSANSSPCPSDGATPEHREDIVESAIELALERSAEVLVVHHELEEFAAHGSIAALLRY